MTPTPPQPARTPILPRVLGFAGLLPQLACLGAVVLGSDEMRWTALAMGWAYAALIFSFLGALWWGLAAAASRRIVEIPGWIWLTAIMPSLFALATFYPWVVGAPWPQPALVILGIAILSSPLADLCLRNLRPAWWMGLRIPLSLGLGLSTLALGLL